MSSPVVPRYDCLFLSLVTGRSSRGEESDDNNRTAAHYIGDD